MKEIQHCRGMKIILMVYVDDEIIINELFLFVKCVIYVKYAK